LKIKLTQRGFYKKQLTFNIFDSVDSSGIEKSKLNILKTELFGEVKIDVFKVDSGFEENISPYILRKENKDDSVEVRVTAKEMLVFLPSLGFSTTKPYSITLGASYGNLFRERHKIELAFTFLDVRGVLSPLHYSNSLFKKIFWRIQNFLHTEQQRHFKHC